MKNLIKEHIDKAKNIVITGHENPDGDAIGAAIALKLMIEKYDNSKNVKVYFKSGLPRYVEKLDNYISDSINFDIDLLISVDTANYERLNIDKEYIENSKFKINIDHHVSNTKYFDINYVKDEPSASEIIYTFIETFKIDLDENIAKYIYLGIINDTGNFAHPNVKDTTFKIAYELKKTGINTSLIHKYIFSKTFNKVKLFSSSISNGKYFKDKKFMFYYLDKKTIDENSYIKDDSEGLSEYLLNIEDVDISLFLRDEDEGIIKGSFRSKGKYDVNRLSAIFGGGGHINAAGFKTNLSSEKILERVLEEI